MEFEVPGHPDTRYVVFDCETTGLDPSKDGIISIGAIAVQQNEIVLADSFECLIRTAFNSPAVLVHGITSDESQAGVQEEEAIREFVDYLGPAVLVGHHVGFDLKLVSGAAERHLGHSIGNFALDTMRLVLHLEEAGLLEKPEHETFDLDSLLERFEIAPHDRHLAAGDAFLTARLFLRLLRVARETPIDWPALDERNFAG